MQVLGWGRREGDAKWFKKLKNRKEEEEEGEGKGGGERKGEGREVDNRDPKGSRKFSNPKIFPA